MAAAQGPRITLPTIVLVLVLLVVHGGVAHSLYSTMHGSVRFMFHRSRLPQA